MSHEIETMAWTNQVPWHGLGQQVASNMTTDQMMKAAGLDWEVEKVSMKTADAGEAVDGFYALRRNTDHRIFDVCGSEYTPVQNHEAFEFFREFVEAGKATMETAGSLKGGKMVWGLANLNASFKLAGNDTVKSYLLLANPHQQGKASIFKYTGIRVVCNNTIAAALKHEAQDAIRRAHRGVFNEEAREAAKEALGIARDQHTVFAAMAKTLSREKMTPLEAAQAMAKIFGADDLVDVPSVELIRKDAPKALAFAMQAIDHAPGHDLASAKGTAWGVLNAVTFTTDHLIRKSSDSRMFNAWFGKSDKIKQKAMAVLTGQDD
jgi:phage/plasmid-like protein (TIGR03299 family)